LEAPTENLERRAMPEEVTARPLRQSTIRDIIWTCPLYCLRAVWPGPQRRPHSPSARGGSGLVATRTTRSSHRPPSPRTQGPWGRTRFRVLDAEVTAQSLDEAELVATTGPTNREVRRHSPAATPRGFALYVSPVTPPQHRLPESTVPGGRAFVRAVSTISLRPHPPCADR